MDGKIATKTGESKWISGEKSREHAHSLRNKYTCIMAGIGTVLADDPMLNCRIAGGRNPVRVICDSSLKIPLESNIVKTAKDIPTIVACTRIATVDSKENADINTSTRADKIAALQKAGIEVFTTDGDKVDLKALMAHLAEKKLDSVLIEGGGEINFSALNAGIVNKVYAYIAPQCFGGSAKSPVGGAGIEKICDSFKFKVTDTKMIDGDVLVEFAANDCKPAHADKPTSDGSPACDCNTRNGGSKQET